MRDSSQRPLASVRSPSYLGLPSCRGVEGKGRAFVPLSDVPFGDASLSSPPWCSFLQQGFSLQRPHQAANERKTSLSLTRRRARERPTIPDRHLGKTPTFLLPKFFVRAATVTVLLQPALTNGERLPSSTSTGGREREERSAVG